MRTRFLARLPTKLKKDGVDLIEATSWLVPLMPPQTGFILGPKLSAAQQADVEFGFKIAKEISRLEIGQLVVVKDGTVSPSKASRARTNALPGAANPCRQRRRRGRRQQSQSNGAHDMRFDVPCSWGANARKPVRRRKFPSSPSKSGKSLYLNAGLAKNWRRKIESRSRLIA